MAIFQFGPDPDDEENKKMMACLPPGYAETLFRNCVQTCWMSLPAERRNIDELEREMRRIVDRVFKHMREDDQAAGI